ncbi:MAG TPA: ABC transporter permease [Pyrinomonadaceae bacterium]
MKKILIIAQREFFIVVKQPAYLISFVGVPLLLVVILGVIALIVRQGEGTQRNKTSVVGVFDRAGVVNLQLAPTVLQASAPELEAMSQPANITFVSYDNIEAGLQDLRHAKIRVLYTIEADYLQSGAVKSYTRNVGLFSGNADATLPTMRRLLRASLLNSFTTEQKQADPASELASQRVLDATEVRVVNVTSDGRVQQIESELREVSRLVIPLMLAFLLTSSIFVASGYLLRAVTEEKSSRTMEILLSSVKPNQLLWGKLMGLSGAALLQMTVYMIMCGIAISALGPLIDITLSRLAMSFIYSVLGFLFYAGILTGIGIIAGTQREGMQIGGFLGFLATIPMIFLGILLNEPNGTTAQVLSYIPFTSAVTMTFRLNIADVPLSNQIGVLLVLMVATSLTMLGAAKILRTAALLYGKRARPREIFTWLLQS